MLCRIARGAGSVHTWAANGRRTVGHASWVSCGFGRRPVLEALVEGNRLACERLDDVLRRLDVYEIPCIGQPFDPTRMQAAEVVTRTAAPAGVAPGTVLEVFRAGYTNNGRVLRFAEVKIVADSTPKSGEPEHV